MRGLLLKITNKDSLINLHIKNSETKKIEIIEDHDFQPYFYLKTKKEPKLGEGLKDIKEEKGMLKIIVETPSDVPKLREKARELGQIYEYDIPYTQRYLIDKGLKPMKTYEWQTKDKELQGFKETEELTELERRAFDIETYNPQGMPREELDPVIMTSFWSGDDGQVYTWKPCDKPFVKTFENEETMLEDVNSMISNSDILYTYNGDNFDLPYVQKRSDKKGVKHQIKLQKAGPRTKAQVKHVHIDAYTGVNFLSIIGALKLPRYTLEDVYKEFTGKEKLDIDVTDLWARWDKGNIDIVAEYSLQDAEAAYVIGERLLPLYTELSKLLHQSIYDVSRMSASHMVELLLLRRAFERKEVAPNKPSDEEFVHRIRQPIKGAFVKQPESGLHENIVILDFRSLYPTIIISHNVSPETLDMELSDDQAYVSPNGYKFRKDNKGIIPQMLEEVINRRIKVKKRLKETTHSETKKMLNAEQQALKIIANATYGYLLYARARWYNRECGKAVTAWGRQYVKDAIKKAEEAGFKALYGDSLDYNRRIFVKGPKGIELVKIGDFVEKYDYQKYETLSFDMDEIELRFSKVKRAIKHGYDPKKKGKLLKITTNRGETITTPQHSVYKKEGKKIALVDASKLKEGDSLVSLIEPPINEKYKEGQILDGIKLLLSSGKKPNLRAYKTDLQFPKKNKKERCPFCGKNYVLYSHISGIHADRKKLLEEATREQVFIGAKYAGGNKIPRYWKLTKELMWILGYYCAEGSVSTGNKKLLSFGSQDKKNIERVKRYFEKELGNSLKIITSRDKRTNKDMYYYIVQQEAIVELIMNGFGAGKGSDGKKVPPIVLNAEEKLKKAFLDGYTEGDGSIVNKKDKRYKSKFLAYSSKSKDLAIGVHYLLKTINQGKNKRKQSINQIYWEYRRDKPKISNIRTVSTQLGEEHTAKILRIEQVKPSTKNVYDLEVEKHHNFVDAEGLILVHNTDSVFLKRGSKSKEDVMTFLKNYNNNLPEAMQLELEGFYPRGIFVTKREGGAAKKRYALIREDGQIEIKGLEFVRSDWSSVAKKTQEKVIRAVLENKVDEAKETVAEVIEKTRAGEIPVEEFVIYTQLKRPIEKYAAIGPHVRAAKRLQESGEKIFTGMTIGYVVTRGAGNIGDRSYPLQLINNREPDPDYYICHQILPAVMKILAELGIKEDDLKVGGTQSSLDAWT